MGVIHVVAEASKRGYVNGDPDWCNFGQGQPEVGDLPGAPPRITTFHLEPGDHAYGPQEGIPELRQAIADHYNRLYRREAKAQYGPEHVAVAQGGRLALSRALGVIGAIAVGHQLPDYPAYSDMLDVHIGRLNPHPLATRVEDGFVLEPDAVKAALEDLGLQAFVLSNPCNPTGGVIHGEPLRQLVKMARPFGCTFLFDEFYSHYIYAEDESGHWGPAAGPVSAAAYVEDVDEEPVLIIDGLTKNFRYPGWRLGWMLGPPAVVDAIARVASALDGGPSAPVQRAALDVLEPSRADQETAAVRAEFAHKRAIMIEGLRELGITFAAEPAGTFYAWGCLAELPPPLNDASTFFQRALERNVMTVPGEFFDVNPGHRRATTPNYRQWMRFSFGPPRSNIELGIERLADMVAEAQMSSGLGAS
jgi:aspartate/methionine/tyrosine aminotransferase